MPAKKRPPKERPRDFDFYTYEVAFALAIGGFLAALLALFSWQIVMVISLLGVSWGLTHLVGRFWMRRRFDKQISRAEQEERERRALAARSAASLENEQHSRRRRRRRSV
jgi:fatty acid desaturase